MQEMTPVEFLEFAEKCGALRSDRWEKGDPHHPKTQELFRFMKAVDDFQDSEGGGLDLKCGGDGDIGESLMYLMDAYFDAKDALEKKTAEFVYRIVNGKGEFYGGPTGRYPIKHWHKKAGKFFTLKAAKAVLDTAMSPQQRKSVFVQKFRLDNVANMIPSELP